MTEREPSPPGSTDDEGPKWKQVVWLVCGGIVLAIGGCGFFFLSINSWGGGIGAVVFVIGIVLFLAGCVRGLFRAFRRKRSHEN